MSIEFIPYIPMLFSLFRLHSHFGTPDHVDMRYGRVSILKWRVCVCCVQYNICEFYRKINGKVLRNIAVTFILWIFSSFGYTSQALHGTGFCVVIEMMVIDLLCICLDLYMQCICYMR